MKRTQLQELKQKPTADLLKDVEAARKELFQGRIARVVEGKGLGLRKRALRRQIARCLTIVGQRQKDEVKA